MTDTPSASHPVANPRRTMLPHVAAPRAATTPPAQALTMVGDVDGAVCVDGVCALPE
ncbi:hypothetical protein [Oerskovia flava]|uniref:hypothetical protein n=1 Tax=Oerskovia flava TaxID=2986422 RepID=UPI002240BD3F|nr:hypothetical protein [Oerskovia sp. JB1-3-2]